MCFLCLRGIILPIELNYNFALAQILGKIAKCLSQLGMEKHKNRKMPVSIRYGKNVKIAKCLSQLGMEKIAKCPSQLGMEKT